MRASISAGPALSRSTSSMPQSAATTASPPSVRISSTGWSEPVVRISRHRSRAWASSRRPSIRTRSDAGASSRALPSAGRILTWCGSSARPGSTSAEGWVVLVSRSSVLMHGTSSGRPAAIGQDIGDDLPAGQADSPAGQSGCATGRPSGPRPAWTRTSRRRGTRCRSLVCGRGPSGLARRVDAVRLGARHLLGAGRRSSGRIGGPGGRHGRAGADGGVPPPFAGG